MSDDPVVPVIAMKPDWTPTPPPGALGGGLRPDIIIDPPREHMQEQRRVLSPEEEEKALQDFEKMMSVAETIKSDEELWKLLEADNLSPEQQDAVRKHIEMLQDGEREKALKVWRKRQREQALLEKRKREKRRKKNKEARKQRKRNR